MDRRTHACFWYSETTSDYRTHAGNIWSKRRNNCTHRRIMTRSWGSPQPYSEWSEKVIAYASHTLNDAEKLCNKTRIACCNLRLETVPKLHSCRTIWSTNWPCTSGSLTNYAWSRYSHWSLVRLHSGVSNLFCSQSGQRTRKCWWSESTPHCSTVEYWTSCNTGNSVWYHCRCSTHTAYATRSGFNISKRDHQAK